jgi:hypothetical protein
MWTSLTLISITTVAFIAWQKRQQVAPAMPGRRPAAVSRTVPAAAAPRHLLRLVADPSCPATRSFAGRVVLASEAVPLHVVGCRGECRCHYEAIRERRHDARRTHQDRRDTLRFDRPSERRIANDRRSGGQWESHHRF